MRIIQLYKDYYPPTVGGIEQTVARMSTWLAKQGAEVTVLTSNPGSRRTVTETVDGVRVIRCGEWMRALSAPLCPTMPATLGRLRADICHLHYPSPPGEVSWFMARPRGAMVITWHCDIVRQKAVLPVYGHFIRSVLSHTSVVMPTHEGQAEQSPFLRHIPEKIRVLPLGIELPAADAASDGDPFRRKARWGGRPVILFVGRLVAYKGLEVLLQAMRSVDATCVIVGSGPESERLKALSGEWGLSGKVNFVGRIEPGSVPEYIAAADVGVLPSIARQETYGLAMAEMMSRGVPMVSTELGTGTSFVNLHGVTGLVVPPHDPAALAAALNRILEDPALRVQFSHAARERARALFSAEAMMQGLLSVYQAVLDGKSMPLERAGSGAAREWESARST